MGVPHLSSAPAVQQKASLSLAVTRTQGRARGAMHHVWLVGDFTAGSAQEEKGQGERGHVQSKPPASLGFLPPDAKLPPRCQQKELLSCLAWLVI